MDISGSTRIATSEELRRMNKFAVENFNRAFDPTWLAKSLDPAGSHVVTIFMEHTWHDGALVEPHWRCEVLVKTIGNDTPVRGWLDVEKREFDRLDAPPAKPLITSEFLETARQYNEGGGS